MSLWRKVIDSNYPGGALVNYREIQQVWVDLGFLSRSRPHDRVAQMEKLARHIRGEVYGMARPSTLAA